MNERARVGGGADPVHRPCRAKACGWGSSVDEAIARVLGDIASSSSAPRCTRSKQRSRSSAAPRHAVTCASGTDALLMVLMARGIGPGDAVICPTFTFAATAEVVALLGATPVFADVEEASFNLDPESLRGACAVARVRASPEGRDSSRSLRPACRP